MIPTLFAVVRLDAPASDRRYLFSTWQEFNRSGVLWGVCPTTFRSSDEAAAFAAEHSDLCLPTFAGFTWDIVKLTPTIERD